MGIKANNNNSRIYKNALGYTETYAPSANTYGSILPQKKLLDSTVETGTEPLSTGVETTGAETSTGVTTYAQTLKDLEAMRSGAMQGAEAQYQRAQASYGTTGAALSSAGLANSGYAAALDSAAYASMARSKDAAQTAYGQGVAAADYARQTSYADTLAKLMGGEYTGEQAKLLGQTYGYTKEQMQGLDTQVATQIREQIKADPSAYTLDYYDQLAARKTITPDEASAYKAEQNRAVYDQVNRIVKSGNLENINSAATDLENLYKNGNIDEPTYNKSKKLLSSAPVLTAKFSSGAITAKDYIDGMVSDNAATAKLDYVKIGEGIFSGLYHSASLGDDIDIVLPTNEKFDLRTEKLVIGETEKYLNDLYDGKPSHNQIALYEGSLYAYNKSAGVWMKLRSDVDEIDKAIAAILKYQQSKS